MGKCLICDNVLKGRQNRKGQKFCSHRCFGISHINRVNRKCLNCGKIFYIKVSHIDYKGQGKYCSLKCRSKSKIYLNKISKANINAWKLGKKKTYIRSYGYGRNWKQTEKVKNILRKKLSGKNHPQWKGGISKTREYKKIYSGFYRQRILKLKKLSIHTIQRVYEDNIKKYGRLTCYLCLKPIDFGQDSLEHKIPVARNGTNEYSNLGIAHRFCNSKKSNKTPEEYKEYVRGKNYIGSM